MNKFHLYKKTKYGLIYIATRNYKNLKAAYIDYARVFGYEFYEIREFSKYYLVTGIEKISYKNSKFHFTCLQ